MSKYLKLAEYCDRVEGKMGTMIFDFKNKKAYHVDLVESNALKKLLRGISIEEVAKGNNQVHRFIVQMIESGVGIEKNNWMPSEKVHKGPMYELHPEYRIILSKLFIELPGECKEKCDYCGAAQINGCFSCKKPINKEYDKDFYFRMLSEAIAFKFKNIYFHGGNLFLNGEYLKEVIGYTNRLLDKDSNIFLICNIKQFKKDTLFLIKKLKVNLIVGIDCYNENLENIIQNVNKIKTYLCECKYIFNLKLDINSMKLFPIIQKVLMEQSTVKNVMFTLTYKNEEEKLEYHSSMPKIICDESSFRFWEKIHPCLGGTLSITSNGKVQPCPDINEIIGVIDYKKNKTFSQIFNNQDKIMKFWGSNAEKIETCKDCEYRKTCSDCRALDFKFGDIKKKIICNREQEIV